MRVLCRLFLSMLLLVFSGASAVAMNADWTISETKGAVVVIDSHGEHMATIGLAVAPGATVHTKARSSAVLVRGREFVTLRQNAQIRIPELSPDRSIMQIIQDYGSALFNIGKQADPHFGVKTPYLAAVVKGTTFIIAVSADGATLQVTEGAVEASTPDGGARELILPGAVAMVAAGDTMRMVIEGGEGRRVIDSPARPTTGQTTPGSRPRSGLSSAPDRGANRVDEMIASSPGDLRSFSGGFASGEVAVLAAVIVADNSERGRVSLVNSIGGRGSDGDACFGSSCAPGGNGSAVNDDGNGNNDRNGNGCGAESGDDGAGDDSSNGNNGDAGEDDRDHGDDHGDNSDEDGDEDRNHRDDGDDDRDEDRNGNGNGNNGNGNGNGGGNGTGNEGNGNGDGNRNRNSNGGRHRISIPIGSGPNVGLVGRIVVGEPAPITPAAHP